MLVEGNNVQGTFVYYPNKDKPKMWIGNYKILNPEDILCTNVAEKIGISEEQWKNYIKIKNTTQKILSFFCFFVRFCFVFFYRFWDMYVRLLIQIFFFLYEISSTI
ncbi:hypothetical protein [Plasmodium yoelii yoelii]|uniref:Uncharacterized protein n=1 Tax=Plasmodium yoelii yoelii TaxID=73239 RepID=Q7RIA8_PLAYO|nr:hypothetical protein [Plasmodium yoelii yoelii]